MGARASSLRIRIGKALDLTAIRELHFLLTCHILTVKVR